MAAVPRCPVVLPSLTAPRRPLLGAVADELCSWLSASFKADGSEV